jgi:hypothetical protein
MCGKCVNVDVKWNRSVEDVRVEVFMAVTAMNEQRASVAGYC